MYALVYRLILVSSLHQKNNDRIEIPEGEDIDFFLVSLLSSCRAVLNNSKSININMY
jgi:hypothetical protein